MSYLSKRFSLEYLKNIDIQKVGIYYTTPISNIEAERRKDYECYSTDTDVVAVCETELYDDVIDINLAEYDYTSVDEIDDFINDVIKDYDHYLIVALNSKWNGASGYKIVDNKNDIFYRGYDCSQYVKGGSKGGKYTLLKESHHDVPTGHYVLVMGLTDTEYEKFDNMSIDDIIEIGRNKVESMI